MLAFEVGTADRKVVLFRRVRPEPTLTIPWGERTAVRMHEVQL